MPTRWATGQRRRDYPGLVTPEDLSSAVVAAIRAAVEAGELAVEVPPSVPVVAPKVKEHGDFSSNAALQLARSAGRPPREVASLLAARLREVPGVAAVDIAGPGFLNITLESAALGELARGIVRAGAGYGWSDDNTGQHVNLEYVSANPTGPIHIGGARWAAVGDSLARLLEASGAEVTREYYFNDAGAQIDRFAASLDAAARGEPVPEDGYGGDYIVEIAQRILANEPGLLEADRRQALDFFRTRGVELMFDEIKRSLADFGVVFDVYFSERSLHEEGRIVHAIEVLRRQGHLYDSDGALWLRTTDFGDDKDRVLIKSDGAATYFAADAAYYVHKRERGYDRCVYMLGADHHGYVARLKALAACAGDDPDTNIEILIGQLVNLVKEGVPVRMSKRAGTVITLEDLVDAVGVDAARYALARSSSDSQLDLDLDLLASRTNDNPVFYVQYAHARLSSLMRNAAELGISLAGPGQADSQTGAQARAVSEIDVALLGHEREVDLLRALSEFPRVVSTAAALRQPHRVARYLEDLAGTYHRFYDACRVLPRGDETPTDLTYARLLLCEATRVVLANGLGLLGVRAPERM